MKKKSSKALREKAALDYLLAHLFDTKPNELLEYLYERQQEQIKEDPFLPEVIVENEPKPLKFLTNSGGERFKALREKVLAKEQQEITGPTEGSNESNN